MLQTFIYVSPLGEAAPESEQTEGKLRLAVFYLEHSWEAISLLKL